VKALLPNPWKGAQDRNDHKDVRDEASCNHSRILYGAISYDADNLVY
jgi:hypothetical protein